MTAPSEGPEVIGATMVTMDQQVRQDPLDPGPLDQQARRVPRATRELLGLQDPQELLDRVERAHLVRSSTRRARTRLHQEPRLFAF